MNALILAFSDYYDSQNLKNSCIILGREVGKGEAMELLFLLHVAAMFTLTSPFPISRLFSDEEIFLLPARIVNTSLMSTVRMVIRILNVVCICILSVMRLNVGDEEQLEIDDLCLRFYKVLYRMVQVKEVSDPVYFGPYVFSSDFLIRHNLTGEDHDEEYLGLP